MNAEPSFRSEVFAFALSSSAVCVKNMPYITLVSSRLGSICVLIFFNTFNSQEVVKTVQNPTLSTYNNLQMLYRNSLKCPCATITIPNQAFITFSPVLHQICSNNLVSEQWISILRESITRYVPLDWRNKAFQQFQLLSSLCQLSKRTIDDAVHRYLLESFITSSALTEIDFNTEFNATLNQFFQSTTVYFEQLVDTVALLMQVDQLYMGSATQSGTGFESNLAINMIENVANLHDSIHVCLFLNCRFSLDMQK